MLDVYLGDLLVAYLEQASPARLSLRYTPAAIAQNVSLSAALPARDEPYDHDAASPFFEGLLPEGEALTKITRSLGTSRGNVMATLEQIGRDCGGAVTILPTGESPSVATDGHSLHRLTDADLAALIDELPNRPLGIDVSGDVRLSLGGVQDKLVLVRHPDGGLALPVGGAASTHILKPQIRDQTLDDTAINEAFSLAICRTAGLPAATAELMRIGDRVALLVERYDRSTVDDVVRRIHQEDACQALAISPDAKYEAEGGPGVAEVVTLIRRVARPIAASVLGFLDQVVARYVIGDHGGHGKNVSFLYRGSGPQLTPLYDVVCTAAYRTLSRRLAMKIANEARGEHVASRHWDRLADNLGLGGPGFRARRRHLGAALADAVPDVRRQFVEAGFDVPVLDRISATITTRAQRL